MDLKPTEKIKKGIKRREIERNILVKIIYLGKKLCSGASPPF